MSVWSRMLYCLTALITPMITAMNAAMITVGITICSVIQQAAPELRPDRLSGGAGAEVA